MQREILARIPKDTTTAPAPAAPTTTSPKISLPSAPVPVSNASSMDERHLRALARIAAGTNHSEEQLIEQFQTLPEGLKRAITTVDTANAIQEIAKKFLLHIDQMAALASETGLVLLGFTHPRDFVKNLAARLRISEQRALEIAKEVGEQILVKVREALRNLHENAENPKSEIRNPKQIPISKTNASLPTTNYKLQTSSTPYSKEAKWNTGAADGKSQTTISKSQTILTDQKEENPTKEEVLRGIENPSGMRARAESREPKTEERVGPTGWRAGQNETQNMKYEIGRQELPRPMPAPPRPLVAEDGRNFESRIPNLEKYQKKETENEEKTLHPLASPKPPTPPSVPLATKRSPRTSKKIDWVSRVAGSPNTARKRRTISS